MTARSLLLSLALVACGDDAMLGPDAAVDVDGSADGPVQPICLDRATYPMSIQAGAFPPSPDHPNVIVYVPQGFDASAPIDVVVFVHGFNNCITDVLGDDNIACTSGGPIRNAYQLATQLEASGKNALLVLPEVAYDQATGNPGALGTAGGFRALLEETLANLPAPLGPLALSQIGKVIVSVHSGGYAAVAPMITMGDVRTDEVWLFDALYGYTTSFEAWMMSDLASFAQRTRRFGDVYTSGGGTLANSQAMADAVAMWVDASTIVDDRTTATWPDATYQHGMLFKASALSHDDVPRYYFERFLSTSQLGPRCQ